MEPTIIEFEFKDCVVQFVKIPDWNNWDRDQITLKTKHRIKDYRHGRVIQHTPAWRVLTTGLPFPDAIVGNIATDETSLYNVCEELLNSYHKFRDLEDCINNQYPWVGEK